MKKILSIDGGGIRGIIPAMILAEIERRSAEIEGSGRKFIPTSELFDLIAGTSTGGILALALTRPVPSTSDSSESDANPQPAHPAERLVELYEKKGRLIFDRTWRRRISSADGWLDERYSSRGIEEVLEEYFEDTCLTDALIPVLIPSYDMQGTAIPC